MKYKYVLLLLIGIASLSAFRLPLKNILSFKTSTGHIVKVFKGQIFYDSKVIFKRKYDDDILYGNKANRLIEDHGVVFLFIAVDDRPNLEKLNAFLITPTKATLVANAILSSIEDYDGDGYLEFGGRDLTEMYSNRDSMYYIPTAYYEIREGKIHPDNSLTKSEDIKLNGLYLPPSRQLDKDGNCCKVVPTPGRKHTLHVQPQSDLIAKSFMGSDTITVLATQYVLNGKDEITNVDHFNDGSWLFYSNNRTYTTETAARKVKLASIIKLDKSILLLSWMPKGYVATRSSKTAPWGWNKLKDKN
jgi:hypothetical protein